MTITGTGSYKDFRLYVLDPSYTSGIMNDGLWTADGTSGIHYWGAQLSDSASLDTYVPNYGAAPTAAAYYGPRLDFDGATLAAKGLLVEELRANLLLYSAAFDNAAWGGISKSVTPDAAVAPSAETKADEITFTSNVGNFAEISQYKSVDAGTYTQSVFIKAYPGEEGKTLTFDTPNASGAATTITLTNQWQRVTKTFTVASTVSVGVRLISYTGQTASKFYTWGAQLEAGSFPTSYIPTGAATVTRAADVASVSTQAFPYSSTEGTIVVNYDRVGIKQYSRLFTLGDVAGNNQVSVLNFNAGQENPYFVTSGSATTVTGPSIPAANAVSKMGLAFKTGDNAYSLNGATATANATSFTLSATDLSLGYVPSSGQQLNGHIRQITYLPRRISNTELQTRTS
jgi:hypothetical protein